MKTRLNHVRINVKDLFKSIEWYENVLGFKTDMKPYPSDKPVYVSFEQDEGAAFSIMVDEGVPSYGRFNFDVFNVDELWETIKDKVDVVEPLFDTPYGTRKFTIKDPDGNELGFCNNPEYNTLER
jgi:predicted enzyme related to lactoylglutathione lyase